MENWTKIKKGIFCIGSLFVIMMIYFIIGTFIAKEKEREREEARYFRASNEFLRTIDCAEVFDTYSNSSFELEFEICATKPGEVLVYQQNGAGYRYTFRHKISVTEEYTKFRLVVEPVLVDETVKESYLSFYGEYGSGVVPTVRDISIVPIDNEN